MSSTLIRNLRAIVTCDDGDHVLSGQDICIDNGVIRAIGPNLEIQALLSRPDQYPPPSLPDLFPEFGGGAEYGAVSLAALSL